MTRRSVSPQLTDIIGEILESIEDDCGRGERECAVQQVSPRRKEIVVFLEAFLVQFSANVLKLEVVAVRQMYPQIAALQNDAYWREGSSEELLELVREVFRILGDWKDIVGANYVSNRTIMLTLVNTTVPRLLASAGKYFATGDDQDLAKTFSDLCKQWKEIFGVD